MTLSSEEKALIKKIIRKHITTCQISREMRLTQSSIVWIIHCNECLKCPFRLTKRLFPIIVSFLTFIFHNVV